MGSYLRHFLPIICIMALSNLLHNISSRTASYIGPPGPLLEQMHIVKSPSYVALILCHSHQPKWPRCILIIYVNTLLLLYCLLSCVLYCVLCAAVTLKICSLNLILSYIVLFYLILPYFIYGLFGQNGAISNTICTSWLGCGVVSSITVTKAVRCTVLDVRCSQLIRNTFLLRTSVSVLFMKTLNCELTVWFSKWSEPPLWEFTNLQTGLLWNSASVVWLQRPGR